MVKAIWNDIVIAQSDQTIYIEFNHYFPPDTVKMEHLQLSERISRCPNKGQATWNNVIGNDKRNRDAAWTYKFPTPGAVTLKDHIAFNGNVKIIKEEHEKINIPGTRLFQKIFSGTQKNQADE